MSKEQEIKYLNLCRLFSPENTEEILNNHEIYNSDQYEGVEELVVGIKESKEDFIESMKNTINVEGNEEYLDYISSIPAISTFSNALSSITFSAGVHSHEDVHNTEDFLFHSTTETVLGIPLLKLFSTKLLDLIDKDSPNYSIEHFLRYKKQIDKFLYHDKPVKDAPLLADFYEYITQILIQDCDNPEVINMIKNLSNFEKVANTIRKTVEEVLGKEI